MKNFDELEKKLKQYAETELETELDSSQLGHVVNVTRKHEVLREGVGFIGAFFWVLLAGIGLRVWTIVHHKKTSAASEVMNGKPGIRIKRPVSGH